MANHGKNDISVTRSLLRLLHYTTKIFENRRSLGLLNIVLAKIVVHIFAVLCLLFIESKFTLLFTL